MNPIDIYNDKSILFFDGVCNLCDGFVQWTIKRDPDGIFHYASLQSDFAKTFLKDTQLNRHDISTVVLYQEGKIYAESDVALEMSKKLGLPWSLAYPFKLIPRIVRDGIYRWVARNRYRWFGKKEACMVPTPTVQNRFLDNLGS